jgi:hypothetical protein
MTELGHLGLSYDAMDILFLRRSGKTEGGLERIGVGDQAERESRETTEMDIPSM